MSQHAGQQDLEQRIAQALDHAPQVSISQDFAARVASQLPQHVEVSPVRSTYARRLAVVCVVLLAAGLLVLAVRTPTTFTLSEMLLSVELGLLTLWLVAYRRA